MFLLATWSPWRATASYGVKSRRGGARVDDGGRLPHAPIVVPELLGGIGNQLYVVSAAIEYARRHGCRVVIDVSVSSVPSWGEARPTYYSSLFSLLSQRDFGGVPPGSWETVDERSFGKPPRGGLVRLGGGYYQDSSRWSSPETLEAMRDRLVPLCDSRGDEKGFTVGGADARPQIPRDKRDVAVHARMGGDASTHPGAGCCMSASELTAARQYLLHLRETAQGKADEGVATSDGFKARLFSNMAAEATAALGDDVVEPPADGDDEVEVFSSLRLYNTVLISPSTFSFWACMLHRSGQKSGGGTSHLSVVAPWNASSPEREFIGPEVARLEDASTTGNFGVPVSLLWES
jgi:hypothetical protein